MIMFLGVILLNVTLHVFVWVGAFILFADGWTGGRPLASARVFEPIQAALSPSEMKVQRALEEELKKSTPTHRVWLTGDRPIEGILESETESMIVLKQPFGADNFISIPYKKSELLRVETLPPVPITPADVRLKLEFPELRFFKRPPYAVVTDESYFLVRHAMDELERLHDQFRRVFSDWTAGTKLSAAAPVQIVFFGDQDSFRRYVTRNDLNMESASGFYSVEKNRLVLFNQTASEDLQDFRRKVDDLRRQWQKSFPNGIPTEIETQLRLLESRGLDYTYMVIRHEGAHQLLHTYGVLTARPSVPWLEEGMAAYFEVRTLGARNPYRIQDLKALQAEQKLIPWRSLIDYLGVSSFIGRVPDWSKAAYAQSWLVIYSLMSHHRASFLRLLQTLPRPDVGKGVPSLSVRLSTALGMDWLQLEQELDAVLQQVVAD